MLELLREVLRKPEVVFFEHTTKDQTQYNKAEFDSPNETVVITQCDEEGVKSVYLHIDALRDILKGAESLSAISPKQLLLNLCDLRSIFVAHNEEEDFLKECKKADVHPQVGDWYSSDDPNSPIAGRACRNFFLPKPMTKAEGRVIADFNNVVGSYDEITAGGKDPLELLEEWGMA